jgi:hypothetical protein
MKKKFNINLLLIVIGVVALILFWYGLTHGAFKSETNIYQENVSISPNQNNPVYNSCSQVCTYNGYANYYNFLTSCKAGESKITYGYPNQLPLLTCCCYNEQITPPLVHNCSDSDHGENKDIPGTVTYDNTYRYMDYCFDSKTVYEYRCNNDNTWQGGKISCDSGETCLSSHSGGYCKARSWNPGDTVFEQSGSGTISGEYMSLSELDLSDYGITTDGNCRLGAQIQTDWNYGNSFCTGIQGTEGITWKFFDSAGLEYIRVDSSPTSLGVDLSPVNGHTLEWDGITTWKGIVSKTINLPNCLINYNYNIKIYIYDCL